LKEKKILVYGYGNPGRRDDGLGPALVERLEVVHLPGVTTDSNYQLQVEDAAAVSQCDAVIFVDAANAGSVPFSFTGLEPSEETAFTTHSVSPASVLALCRDLYGAHPAAYLLAIRGYEWDMGEGLTHAAKKNLEEALRFIKRTITELIDVGSTIRGK
jgi:hydrogenase maturation protease